MRSRLLFSIIILWIICFGLQDMQAEAALTAKTSLSQINVDLDYHGKTLTVDGCSDPGSELILTIISANESLALKRKDKVAGILWMNVEDIHFDNVPKVYMMRASKLPSTILSKEELERYGIGYEAILRDVHLGKDYDNSAKEGLISELIKYKEASGLYSIKTGQFEFVDGNSCPGYSRKLQWPYQVPPGQYVMTVYEVKNGKVLETAQTSIFVNQAGFVERISNLAREHGATYGIIAIAIALFAGFGVGLIFRKSGGAH